MREDSQSHKYMPAEEQVDLAVAVFQMLSDPTRVRLLWALLDGERPVNELAEAVGKAPAGVSQHLAKLRMARLVRTRRQANQIFYRVDNAHVSQLVEDAIYHAEHAGGGIPEHHRGQGAFSELRSRTAQPGVRPDQSPESRSEERAADE
jgi:DNA-binding transcriptional ArsR family regulator